MRNSTKSGSDPDLTNPDLTNVLERILATKREEVADEKTRRSLAQVRHEAEAQGDVRDFFGAIRAKLAVDRPAVIAEIKKASPSKGVLRTQFDPAAIAASYTANGAACLSVLTDTQYFQGSPQHLTAARMASSLPVLRKDFVVDAYQIYQSRTFGADAILLIVAALTDEQLMEYEAIANELGMAVLVEVHDRTELERVFHLKSPLIGVNNRDLRSFATSLTTTLDLLPQVPADRIVVTESGILAPSDVARMREAGVHAFLVGEALMRAPDPGQELARLFA